MKPTYQRIAYDGLEVANPTCLQTVMDLLDQAELRPEAVAMDIGAGTGAVSVAMARVQGLTVHAIERDPLLAERITERVRSAGLSDRVHVHAVHAADVLERLSPVDLVVALGTTEAAGPGRRAPEATFRALAGHLKSPGHLLWGDLFWKGEPPLPLRQIVGLTGDHATNAGWVEAGIAAGLDCVASEVGSDPDWDAYFGGADTRVRAWLEAHPEAPENEAIRARADQIRAMFEFGRPYLGFGLYLFRKAP